MEEVLYSTFKPCLSDVTGAANQVCDMEDFGEAAIKTIRANNVTAILSTGARGHFLHIHAPRIYKDLQGNSTKIVGNASDVQGEFRMVKIKIKDALWFWSQN